MRAFALACLFLPGCYLSHERAMVDAAVPDAGATACDDTLTVMSVDVARTIPIGGDEMVGHFRIMNAGDRAAGFITAQVRLGGLFGLPAPARVRVSAGETYPGTPLFEGETSATGVGEVAPRMAWPVSSGVAAHGSTDLFVTVETAELHTSMTMRVEVVDVRFIFDDPFAPFLTCTGAVGPTMTFVDLCPTPGTGEFHFDPPGHGPGRGCLTTGTFPRRDFCPPLAPGDLLKGSLHAVYVIDRDGRKVVFPTEVELMSWFADLDADGVPTPFRSGTHICGIIPELSDEAYAAIPLASRVVTVRPGSHVLRLDAIPDDRLWLVSRGNMLRPVSEGVARAIYGSSFDRRIYVIEDGFFGNYHLGSEVRTPEEYDLAFESAALLLDELEVPRP